MILEGTIAASLVSGAVARQAIACAMVFASTVGQAAAVPLPVPRPAFPGEIAAGTSGDRALPPLPVPRPEADGPFLPPVPAPQVFGPALPQVAGPPLPQVPLEAPLPPVPSRPDAGPPPPAPPEPDLACAGLLAGGKVVAKAEPAVSGPDGCGIAAPVTLEAVVLRTGASVPLSPPPLIRCDLAEQVADWIRDDIVPATAAEGDLRGVVDAAGYMCRSRNWVPGARISEHARGNAVDIVAFRFAKRTIGLKQEDAHAFWTTLKGSACARFATVLGPGSDGLHETNLHLDLEHRHNGYRLCHWDDP